MPKAAHKHKLPQCRICETSDAQMWVSNSPGHCQADYALWWALKWGNLRFKVLKNMSNKRGNVIICLGLCLRGWKTLACFSRSSGHCKAIGSLSMATASRSMYKSWALPSLNSFGSVIFLGLLLPFSLLKTLRKRHFSSFFGLVFIRLSNQVGFAYEGSWCSLLWHPCWAQEGGVPWEETQEMVGHKALLW